MPRPISLARFFCVLATAAATLASSTSSGEHPDSITTRIDANVTMTTMDVYYINLARRPDRKAHMLRELARHGVTRDHGFIVKRFNAVDGKADGFLSSSSSYSSYSSRGERKGGGRESEDGGADNVDRDRALFTAFDAAGLGAKPNANVLKANSLSHLGVWREVVASGVAYAVVLQVRRRSKIIMLSGCTKAKALACICLPLPSYCFRLFIFCLSVCLCLTLAPPTRTTPSSRKVLEPAWHGWCATTQLVPTSLGSGSTAMPRVL
jgi:hypothetical protein